MDTGIQFDHPDIHSNMATDSFGNPGRRFYNRGLVSANPMDTHGHGTHVAGIIGAIGNNSIGVAGVNWSVKMLAVSVLNQNIGGYDNDIINGIDYILSEKAKGLNIRVVNMSFGGWDSYHPLNHPLAYSIKSLSDANIICVISAGNDGLNLSVKGYPLIGYRFFPASFNFDNLIKVGSINFNNGKSGFSNYDKILVNVGAPGNEIYSTYINSGYTRMDGTSMSTPHVAGAAAILCAAYP